MTLSTAKEANRPPNPHPQEQKELYLNIKARDQVIFVDVHGSVIL
jgi:hypothetical protein